MPSEDRPRHGLEAAERSTDQSLKEIMAFGAVMAARTEAALF
jgi:hypothetical protein